jgi:general secretion pathway protein C
MKQESGNMKQLISPKLFSSLIFFLSIIIVVKIIWTAISLLLLPNVGEEYNSKSKAKALYYRVRLTNDSAVIAPVIMVKRPKIIPVASMRGIKLLALYNSKDTLVVTVEKNKKTMVLGKGDEIDKFLLISGGANYALFKKNGKEFKLNLNTEKEIGGEPQRNNRDLRPVRNKEPSIKKNIVEQDGVKVINRSLLTNYTANPDKIWKDIGIGENKVNGKLNGFKINYVKKGSDFEKLGLKRGDLLMAINAEKLDSLSGVMGLYKDINNIENLTLTVERNGRSEDIEYEIQ